MANRQGPNAGHYGQARANQSNHSKRLQSSVPGFDASNGEYATPNVRAVGEVTSEAGRAATATAASDQVTLAGHGFSVGDRVKLTALTGGAGIVAGQNYYVNQVIDANNFTVSALPPNSIGSPQDATVVAATDLFTTAAHGLVAGTPVVFERVNQAGLPAAGTTYFVIAAGLTVNDFKVSATRGGATIDVTTDGSVRWKSLGAPTLDITSDATAATVTRYKTTQAGAFNMSDVGDTLPGIPGPR